MRKKRENARERGEMTHILFFEESSRLKREMLRRMAQKRSIIQTKRKWQVFDSSDDHNDKK